MKDYQLVKHSGRWLDKVKQVVNKFRNADYQLINLDVNWPPKVM